MVNARGHVLGNPSGPSGKGSSLGGLPFAGADLGAIARYALVCCILAFFFIGLTPFEDISTVALTEFHAGSEVFVYAATFGLTLLAVTLLPKGAFQALGALARPINVLILGWLFVAVVTSTDAQSSAKRLTISLSVFALAAMTPLLCGGMRNFARLLVVACGIVLFICYAGVLLAPDLAIHQLHDPQEPQLAGSWRGLYPHKNTAAAVMGLMILIAVFAARSGQRIAGLAIGAGAAVFLMFTAGKSTSALIVVALALAAALERVSSLWLKIVLVLAPLALLNFLAFGSVIVPLAKGILTLLPIDPTFTGRVDVWAFVVENIAKRPVTGAGFQAFWFSDIARAAGLSSWAATATDSHNSYADLALTIGLPGLALVLCGFLLAPLWDFHHRLRETENEALASFFVANWVFAIYLASFETFFFGRAGIVWFTLAMSICGLRLLRSFRIHA